MYYIMNSKMETGGVAAMSTVNEIGRLAGLRPIAVAEWGDKNNINLTVILKDLKSKKIKGIVISYPNRKNYKVLDSLNLLVLQLSSFLKLTFFI